MNTLNFICYIFVMVLLYMHASLSTFLVDCDVGLSNAVLWLCLTCYSFVPLYFRLL